MKQFVIIIITALCAAATADAQTFTDHLRQKQQGKATVTVTQSKEIDDLVNGKNTPPTKTATTKPAQKSGGTSQEKPSATRQHVTPASPQKEQQVDHTRNRQDVDSTKKESTHAAGEHKEATENRRVEPEKEMETEEERSAVDMRKKVMRGSHKVTGYRVQVFSGGNSRADKNKAQRIGNEIKMKYPEQPVYVHFYSPRWVCRVGNFRTYAEASAMLKKIRAMGYGSATILKGKITVQY